MSSSPATLAIAVTPSDTTNLPNGPARAFWVGTAGNVALKCTRGSDDVVTFLNVPAGSVLPQGAARVMATNTTATGILAMY